MEVCDFKKIHATADQCRSPSAAGRAEHVPSAGIDLGLYVTRTGKHVRAVVPWSISYKEARPNIVVVYSVCNKPRGAYVTGLQVWRELGAAHFAPRDIHIRGMPDVAEAT